MNIELYYNFIIIRKYIYIYINMCVSCDTYIIKKHTCDFSMHYMIQIVIYTLLFIYN